MCATAIEKQTTGRPIMVVAMLGVIFLLAGGVALHAQVTTASILGQITDPSGLGVPGARVTARNVATGVEGTVTADEGGKYLLSSLQPGTYDVNATATGFKTDVKAAIVLQVNQGTSLDFQLQVGSSIERVTVSGTSALLETATSAVGTVVGEREVLDLPLNGRQFTELIALSPGASPVNVSQLTFASPALGGGAAFPAMAGQNNRSNLFLMDGVYDSEPFFSGFTISPSIDAIQEFKVQTHNDLAEFGQVLGATVNLVTKSGTNQLHGDVYEFLRNTVLDGRNFFAVDRPQFRQNQFGATVGGPVLIPHVYNGRNRTFFFFGYEGFRFNKGATNLSRVPTAAERNGDFSADAPISNPFTTPRTPFTNNQIPKSLFDPGIVAYLGVIPLPNLPPGVAGASNYINAEPGTTTQNSLTARIDQNWGTHDTLFGRFSYGQTNQVAPAIIANNQLSNPIPGRNVGLSWNHIFSSTLMTHFLAGYNRAGYPSFQLIPGGTALLAAGFSQGFPLGAGGVPFPQPPGISVSGYFGTSTSVSAEAPQNVYQVEADVSKVLGGHTLKAGFGRDSAKMNIYGNYPGESYDTLPTADLSTPGTTGNAAASMLLGLPSSANRFLGDTSQSLKTRLYDVYVQDQVRLTPKLNVNFGLRWDFRVPTTETFGRLDSFDPYTGLYLMAKIPPLCPQAGFCLPGPLPAGVAKVRDSFVDPEWRDFQPRLGIAYRLQPTTVVRVGGAMVRDMWSGVFQDADDGMGNWPAGEAQFPSGINLGLGTPGGPPPALAENPFLGVPSTITPTPFPFSGFALNRFIKNPYIYSYNLEVEKSLTNSLTVTVGYVGSRGVKIPNNIHLNVARTPGPGPVAPRTPFPDQQSIIMDNNDNATTYNSLQVQVNKHFSHGLAFLASYTWSKSIDRGCSGFFGVEGCSIQDQYNTFGSRSVSAFDLPQIFTFSAVYQLPAGKGYAHFASGPPSWFLGGWQVNGILSLHSGLPFSPQISFDNANVGIGNQRPNLVGNPNGPHTVQEWFNTSAFAAPALYTWGSAGRDIMRSDGTQNLDFSLFKEFPLPIREKTRVQFRAEVFNIFNHPIFGIPDATLGDATYGQVSSASTPREIQFALKVYF
jgi:hypothetical protein